MIKPVLFLGLVCALVGSPVSAQPRDSAARAEQRAGLERKLRARLGEVVQQRLGLTSEQARQLEAVDRRYQPDRRRLMQREMEVRRSLRQQVALRDSANQATTAALLDQMIGLQRERTELLAREQRDLAAFLTPVQRAQLIALQSDLHRRVMNARRGGGKRSPGREPGRGPPRH